MGNMASTPSTTRRLDRRHTGCDTSNIGAIRQLTGAQIQALVDLVSDLFTPDQLRRFVHFGPEGETLVNEVDFSGSTSDVAYRVVGFLRRAGHIDPAFFARLRQERERRATDIDAVESMCLGSEAAVKPFAATHAVTLVAAIAGQISAIDDTQILAALGHSAPKSWLRIDLHALNPLGEDGGAWTEGQAEIRRKVQDYLRESVLPSGVSHLSLFGLAPIPWLMALGYALSETVETRVFQRFRVPAGWRWQADESGRERWLTRQVSVDPTARDVAILVSASARVQVDRVDAVVPPENRATYTIELENPRIDAVRSESQLEEFGRYYRALLDRIEQEQRAVERVHVFVAAPVAVAIDCGRRILHNADPIVVAYNFVERTYVRALELRR